MAKGAGALDRRITLQRATEGAQDGFGQPATTWATLATVWASRADVSDGERVSAGQRDSALMARFVIRSSIAARSVTTQDRLTHEGATWQIKGVKETGDGRLRFIEITAVKDSD